MKAQIFPVLGMASLFLLSSTLYAQNRQYYINDCESGRPLSGVKIFNSQNKLLATSDATGGYTIKGNDFPLFYEKGSYNLLQVNNEQELQAACMSKMVHQIGEVVISAKRVDPGDYLLQLRDKNIPHFITHDTTLYYKFTYTLEFPLDHWKEQATGYIEHQWRPHNNVYPMTDYYLSYHYSNTGGNFVTSDQYKDAKSIGLGQIINGDLMGHYIGFADWETMAKPGKKSHTVLALENKDSILEFSTYYQNEDIGYTTNKVRFDTAGNLLQFIQLRLPEMYGLKIFKKNTDFYGKDENERNSYYANYQYTGINSQPRTLKSIEEMATCFNKKVYYKVNYKIELVPIKPQKEIYIPAFNVDNGMNIVNWNKVSDKVKRKREKNFKWIKNTFDIEVDPD